VEARVTLRSFFGAPLRALRGMSFSRNPMRVFTLPRSRLDYRREVGNGLGSSTVAAPVQWVAKTFPEAPPALWEKLGRGQEEQIDDHPLLRLLERPNPYHTGPVQWMATTTDWLVDGNAYWMKIRSRANTPIELWWVPSWMIDAKGKENDGSVYIDHYEYRPEGYDPIRVPPEDVVHFRFGLDPDDPRKGYSPLKSVLREVFTDDEAAAFTASLLRNMGVPGLLVAPDSDAEIQPGDAEYTKEFLKEQFTGDRRGEPLVMTSKTKIQQFGFSPEQLLLRELRRIPEERVTAVTGIPAIVAGLGAGLDRSTFTNMAEAREAAYEAGIIPMQRIMAEEIRFQLLTEFEADVHGWRFGFDLSKVRVLQEDLYRQAQRHDLMIRGGWMRVLEGRRAMGLEVDEERDNVFLRQLNVATVRATPGPPPLPPSPPANGNGNGGFGAHDAKEIAREVVLELEMENRIRGRALA
jgi:HK97 family phage portal protein